MTFDPKLTQKLKTIKMILSQKNVNLIKKTRKFPTF